MTQEDETYKIKQEITELKTQNTQDTSFISNYLLTNQGKDCKHNL